MTMCRETAKTVLWFALLSLVALLSACQPKEITSAKIYMSSGDWPKALEQLELAVENYPDNAEAHFLLGRAYGYEGRFQDMVAHFERSLSLSDKFVTGIQAVRERHWIEKYDLAIKAMAEQDFEAAARLLQQAILIDPAKFEAYERLAVTYLNQERNREAIQIYRTLLDKQPDNVDFMIALGNLYYSQQMFEKVVVLLEKVLQLEPDNRDAMANIALAHDALGHTDVAYEAFSKAVAANPTDKDLIFLFAVHQYEQGQFNHAIQLFQQIVALDSTDFEAMSNIGNAYLSMAENYRKRLQNGLPESSPVDTLVQLRQRAIQHYRLAIPFLQKAVSLQPNHPRLWHNLGVALINTGAVEQGEQAFQKAEQIAVGPSRGD